MIHFLVSDVDDNIGEHYWTAFHSASDALKWHARNLECDCDCYVHEYFTSEIIEVDFDCFTVEREVPENNIELRRYFRGSELRVCNIELGPAWYV
jgi:hypothetical protein